MVELTRKQLILAKIESTYRTDPTPTAGNDAILAQDISIKETAPPLERATSPGTLSHDPALLGKRWVELSFKVEMKGSGTAGTAPRHGVLLRACGMSETIVSNTSVTYAPVSTSLASATIWLYVGGRVHKITGCRGSVKGVCEAGNFMFYEFNFMGYRSAAPSVAAIPSPTFDSTTAICKNGTLSWDSRTTLIGKMLDFDVANVIAERPDLADANAIQGFEITDRKPVGSFNPETQTQTSYTFREDALTTTRVLSYTVGGILTVQFDQFNPFEPEFEDDNGILRDKIAGELSATSSGDDEWSLAYTG